MNIPVRQYWRLLVDYLRAQHGRVAVLVVLLLTVTVFQLLNPQLIRSVIDLALSGGAIESVTALAFTFFICAFIQQLVAVLAMYVGENIAWIATNQLRYDLARHALRLDQVYHNLHTPGEMIERIDGDITTLSNFFSQFSIQLVGNGLLLVGIVVLFVREDWRVGLALALFAAIALAILSKLRNVGVPHWKALRQALGELYGFIEERLAGTQDVRSIGAVPYVIRRFYELARRILARQLRASVMQNAIVNGSFILYAFGNAIAFLVGAYLFGRGEATIGTVYLIFYYVNMLNRPLEGIAQQLQDLQQAGASISRVRDLLAERPSLVEGQRDIVARHAPEVRLEHVHFSYDAEETLFTDLDFTLRAGRVVGLLGRTGSGKTTIARLLLRLYDPQRGAVRLDGVDLRDLKFATLRQSVAMVTQTVQLFNATVRDNLTLFDEAIRDEPILEAIRDLGIWSWYERLDQGLDTELASGGGGLSAGEAQLLAFARIFLRDPGLVILDEASSRLDPATEQLIERGIEKLVKNRTAVIIAHRLATVARTDDIMIIEGGQIVEYGDRAALAADPQSKFYQLLQTGLEEVLA